MVKSAIPTNDQVPPKGALELEQRGNLHREFQRTYREIEMIEYREAKTACYNLARSLKLPLAKIQEEFAKANNYRDWNTFAAQKKTQNTPASTNVEQLYFTLGFGAETYLVKIASDNQVEEICMTEHNEQYIDFVEATEVNVDLDKIRKTFNDEWEYGDCWNYVREQGFTAFLKEFTDFKGKALKFSPAEQASATTPATNGPLPKTLKVNQSIHLPGDDAKEIYSLLASHQNRAKATKLMRELRERSNADLDQTELDDLQKYRDAAHEIHGSDGEVEIDEGAVVSLGSDPGAYVQGWLWVPASDAGVKVPAADEEDINVSN